MVYQIFEDGIESSSSSKRFKTRPKKAQGRHLKQSTKSTWSIHVANILIAVIKILLLVYDAISLPIYFLLQRPDRRANEARRIQAQQVDSNTWIRTIEEANCSEKQSPDKRWPFMGATMSEIFTNSIRDHHSKACLGYRAVVTCPMMTQNELGEHVLEEKSFRSDYTWYTYGQIGRRVQDIASGLYYHSVYPTSRALFLASTCLEWFCVAQSCFQLAIELVLVPDVNDLKTLELILIDSEAQTLFVTCDQLARLCKLIELISDQMPIDELEQAGGRPYHIALKRVIVIDWQFAIDFEEDQFQPLGAVLGRCRKRLEILSMGQVEEAGVENPIELRCSRAISEENLNQAQLYDGAGPIGNSFYKSTSRYFNFASNSNGCGDQFVKRRNISDTNTAPAFDGKAAAAEQEARDSNGRCPARRRGNSADAERRTSNKLLEPGRNRSFSHVAVDSSKAPRPDDLAVVVYTHGSLGQLKSIVLTHSQMARSSGRMFLNGMLASQEVHCTILALENVIEFMIEISVFARGGSIGYSCNLQTYFYDGSDLFARDKSDLEALEPSFLLVRPYHLERLRNSTQNYLQLQVNPIMSFVFKNVLYDYKKFWARYNFKTPIVDRVFCSKLKRLFGRRIKYILCLGASDRPSTKDYFAFMADLPVVELYGPDEAPVSMLSISDSLGQHERNSRLARTKQGEKSGYGWRLFQFDLSSKVAQEAPCNEWEEELDEDCGREEFQHLRLLPPRTNRNIYKENVSRNILIISSILCPTPATRIRLEDWEEFSTSDQPYPRGRLVVGGELVCKGYFKRPLLTDESFCLDSNRVRWFRTGDIVRAFPNGTFEIISAISDMIKMVDGQFISLSQIEHLIRGSQFVDNVCAICGGERKFVINLVVPNLRRLALKSMGQASLEMAMSMEPEPEELADVEFRREVCNDRLLCEFVNEHLSGILARSGLASITNRFLLVPEIWTPESELVTPAFRPKRQAIQKFYASDIQSIVKFEFGVSTSRRLSARRRAASQMSSQTSSSAATPAQNQQQYRT